MCFRWLAATVMGAALFAAACYSPNIKSGAYACGADGGCPDNFHCASNHRCYQEADAKIDMMPVCNSVTTTQPVTSAFCSTAAAAGQCNPICQTGCNNCGWCAVTGTAATCLTGTAGQQDVGSSCDPTKNSDCLPGLFCQPETCGNVSIGTCMRICDPSDTKNGINEVCGAKSTCNISAKKSSPFMLCSPICDPLSQSNTSCPAPFGCYPSGATTTECDCAGSAITGDGCQLADKCAPGETCVGPMNAATCRPICTATVGCTVGSCSIPTGAAFGTCN